MNSTYSVQATHTAFISAKSKMFSKAKRDPQPGTHRYLVTASGPHSPHTQLGC